MKKIAVIGRKGGIGKTTTALAVAYGLAMTKRRVLVVDLDVQADLTRSAMREGQEPEIYIGDILANTIQPQALFSHDKQNLLGKVLPKPEKAISHVMELMDLLASNPYDEALSDVDRLDFKDNAGLLQDLLYRYEMDYDYCIIDTPAHLGFLSLEAMNAANSLILPAKAEESSINGLAQFLQYYRQIKQSHNNTLEIEGILITDFISQGKQYAIDRQELTEAAEEIGIHVFPRAIRHSVKQPEADRKGIPIFEYCPTHKIVEDYVMLLREIIEKEEGRENGEE